MKESFRSNWRYDLREVEDDIPSTKKKDDSEIKEKKVNNKVVINPPMGQNMESVIKDMGGELLEMSEIGENTAGLALSTQELQTQKKMAMLNVRLAKQRQRSMNKIKSDAVDIEKQDKIHKKQDKEASALAKEGYETKKKVEVIKALTKKKDSFKKRYGKDAADVMYAVASKTAKKKGDTSKSDDRYAYEEWKPDPVEKRKKKAADLYRREKIAQDTPKKYKTDKTEDPQKLYKRRMAVDSKTKMKEEVVDEAKVDAGKTPHEKETIRNQRNTPPGANTKFDTSVFITRKSGESPTSARGRKRREAHAKRRGVKEEIISEKDLNAAERRSLPDSDFALPGKGEGPQGKQAGSYPIPDEKHARSALSLVAQHGTPEEKAKVRAKVKAKFPNIQQEGVLGSPGTKKLRSASDRSKNSMTDKDRKKQENIRKGRDILTDIQGTQKALDHEVSLDRRISRAKLKKEGYEDKALSNVIASIKKSGGVMASDIPKATDKEKAEWKAERARRVASRSKKSMADVVKSYRRSGESD